MAKYGGRARYCGARRGVTSTRSRQSQLSARKSAAQLDLDLGRPREALVRLIGRARQHRADPRFARARCCACGTDY
jgi:hypothetical protein